MANDLTSRTLQFGSGGQWTLGKNLDRTTPVGPVLGVLGDGETISGRQIRCFVNEEERQNASTSHMILSSGSIIECLSKFFMLRPGDVVLTGTPAGTSMGLPEVPYLNDGDVVRVECDGLGAMESTIRSQG